MGLVLGPEDCLPETAQTLLIVCSNGCFQRPNVVRQLFEAVNLGIQAVPIIVDDTFQFPSESMYAELRANSARVMAGSGRHVDELVALIGCLFEEIAVSFRCQDSQHVIEVRVAAVVERLDNPGKPLMLTLPGPPQKNATRNDETIDVDAARRHGNAFKRICL